MKRVKHKKFVGKELKKLRKQGINPKAKVRVMQITSATTVPFFPVVVGTNENTTIAPTPLQTDRALLHYSPEDFTGLVTQAKAYPEVRSDLVSSYKSLVNSGNYPTQDTMSGLAGVLSGSTE